MRSLSVVRALADAGHRVDIIAAQTDLPENSSIRILDRGAFGKIYCKQMLCFAAIKATGRVRYDVIHAVDEAVFFASQLSRFRKVSLVYDAVRCFGGAFGVRAANGWRFFAGHLTRLEKRVLRQASMVLSSCGTLTSDLQMISPDAQVFQVEDVPIQCLYSGVIADRLEFEAYFDAPFSELVVCYVLSEEKQGVRKLLLAARKVIESVPSVAFVFQGAMMDDAATMAASLDIQGRCVFLGLDRTAEFLSALEHADVSLMACDSKSRYVRPEVYTLLYSPSPLVMVSDKTYVSLLTEKNHVQVLPSSESIAEGVLRVIKEPLFSVKIATEGQQLVADNYSLSSFKHRIRMIYREGLNRE